MIDRRENEQGSESKGGKLAELKLQACIHTGFHRFKEISQIFHSTVDPLVTDTSVYNTDSSLLRKVQDVQERPGFIQTLPL